MKGPTLAEAVCDLLSACGLEGSHICGVTDKFNEESAAEILTFAAKLVRKGKMKKAGMGPTEGK